MEKAQSTESITEILRAYDDARSRNNGVEKFFDWMVRLSIGFLIWYSVKTVEKVDAFSDKFNAIEIQINGVDNKTEIIKHDMETMRKDVDELSNRKK